MENAPPHSPVAYRADMAQASPSRKHEGSVLTCQPLLAHQQDEPQEQDEGRRLHGTAWTGLGSLGLYAVPLLGSCTQEGWNWVSLPPSPGLPWKNARCLTCLHRPPCRALQAASLHRLPLSPVALPPDPAGGMGEPWGGQHPHPDPSA